MHERDVNAAKNILAKGLNNLEISKAAEAKAGETVLNEVPQGAGAGHGPLAVGIIAPLGR